MANVFATYTHNFHNLLHIIFSNMNLGDYILTKNGLHFAGADDALVSHPKDLRIRADDSLMRHSF